MKSRGVTDARSHFNLFKTSSSICCGWWGQRKGTEGQVQVGSRQTDARINKDGVGRLVEMLGFKVALEERSGGHQIHYEASSGDHKCPQ